MGLKDLLASHRITKVSSEGHGADRPGRAVKAMAAAVALTAVGAATEAGQVDRPLAAALPGIAGSVDRAVSVDLERVPQGARQACLQSPEEISATRALVKAASVDVDLTPVERLMEETTYGRWVQSKLNGGLSDNIAVLPDAVMDANFPGHNALYAPTLDVIVIGQNVVEEHPAAASVLVAHEGTHMYGNRSGTGAIMFDEDLLQTDPADVAAAQQQEEAAIWKTQIGAYDELIQQGHGDDLQVYFSQENIQGHGMAESFRLFVDLQSSVGTDEAYDGVQDYLDQEVPDAYGIYTVRANANYQTCAEINVNAMRSDDDLGQPLRDELSGVQEARHYPAVRYTNMVPHPDGADVTVSGGTVKVQEGGRFHNPYGPAIAAPGQDAIYALNGQTMTRNAWQDARRPYLAEAAATVDDLDAGQALAR